MHFYRQQEAFDSLTENQQVVFQNQTHGKRYYVVCTNKEYWEKYLVNNDRYGYEVIRRDLPCHLYVDLDVNKEKYPNIQVTDIYRKINNYIRKILIEQFNIVDDDIHVLTHSSSSDKKGSMHIIYNIKGYIFQSNAHVGAFMRGIRLYVEMTSVDDMAMFDEKWVDMAIYTPNRLFRMLGCTKYGTDRPLVNNNEYTYEEWVKNKVQPVCNSNAFIDIRELDGSHPKYSSSAGGVTGWKPDCMNQIMEQIEDEYAKPNRIVAFPLTHTFSCNLATKLCPFKGEAHSKNRPYANVKLRQNGYTIKCHSNKCKGRETTLYGFNDNVKECVKIFLNRTYKISAITPR